MILLPRIVLIERYAIEKIGEVCKKANLEGKGVVIADKTTRKIAGDYSKDVLEESGFQASVEEINNVNKSFLEKFLNFDADFFLGVGGGRCIDVAKYCSFKKGVPFVSVPTAPSHDGIASDRASLDTDDGKVSIRVEPPVAVVADLELIKTCPERNISAGCADVLSNITAVNDWRKTKDYIPFVGDISLLAANIVISHAKDIVQKKDSGLKALVWSEVLSGFAMSIAGSSAPASGADHNFSHALDALNAGALHGHQCGLGSIVASYLQKGNWVKMKAVLKEVNAPTTATEIGIHEDVLVKALMIARTIRDRVTILDDFDLNEEKAREILKTVGIV